MTASSRRCCIRRRLRWRQTSDRFRTGQRCTAELRRPNLTLALLWEEYRGGTSARDGFGYSWLYDSPPARLPLTWGTDIVSHVT
jgi:hypothetical protein